MLPVQLRSVANAQSGHFKNARFCKKPVAFQSLAGRQAELDALVQAKTCSDLAVRAAALGINALREGAYSVAIEAFNQALIHKAAEDNSPANQVFKAAMYFNLGSAWSREGYEVKGLNCKTMAYGLLFSKLPTPDLMPSLIYQRLLTQFGLWSKPFHERDGMILHAIRIESFVEAILPVPKPTGGHS